MSHFYKIMLSLVFTLGLGPLNAAERDLCICQTGATPEYQVKFFKLGCSTWSMSQSCSEKITISINDSINEVLNQRPHVKSVKLGYVGHWASSKQTVEFLDKEIKPAVINHGVYFDIHNTACSSMSNA
jgi:hypothetical protein